MTSLDHTIQTTNGPFAGRVGFRLNEFIEMTGCSRPTLQRMLRRGDVKTVTVGSLKLIPRSEMIRLGLLEV
jgi:excisionase family DNA binding protein